MSGWFMIHRGWMEGFKPQPFTEREAFLWSIEQAATYAGEERSGVPHVELARGELLTARHKLARTFGWSAARVRAFLGRMERDGFWRVRPSGGGLLIVEVCAFDLHVPPVDGRAV